MMQDWSHLLLEWTLAFWGLIFVGLTVVFAGLLGAFGVMCILHFVRTFVMMAVDCWKDRQRP